MNNHCVKDVQNWADPAGDTDITKYITMTSTLDSFMVIIDIYECFTVYV